MPVKERLLPSPVARQNQPLPAVVPKRQGKHPVQFADEVRSSLLIKVNDHLAVRMGFEFVPALQELLAEFPVVIDFAVKDEGEVPCFVRKGLIAGLKINDAKPPDGEGHMRKLELTLAVGAAMLHPRGHLIDPLTMDHRLELQVQETTNAAHGKSVKSDE